jgi:hypothetical protein
VPAHIDLDDTVPQPAARDEDNFPIDLQDDGSLDNVRNQTAPDDIESASWYYAKGQKELGPLSFQELQYLAATGALGHDDLVWTTGYESWINAREVRGLFADDPLRSWEELSSRRDANRSVPRSRLAVASLVFGILGTTVLLIVGSIVAIVCGHLAVARIRRSGGRIAGHGMAVTGIFLGYIVVIASLLISAGIIIWLIVAPNPAANL